MLGRAWPLAREGVTGAIPWTHAEGRRLIPNWCQDLALEAWGRAESSDQLSNSEEKTCPAHCAAPSETLSPPAGG